MPLHKGKTRNPSKVIISHSTGKTRSELWIEAKIELDSTIRYLSNKLANDGIFTIWLGYGKRDMKYLKKHFVIDDMPNNYYTFKALIK